MVRHLQIRYNSIHSSNFQITLTTSNHTQQNACKTELINSLEKKKCKTITVGGDKKILFNVVYIERKLR